MKRLPPEDLRSVNRAVVIAMAVLFMLLTRVNWFSAFVLALAIGLALVWP